MTQDMNEDEILARLFQGIIDDPGDDTIRLVYADRLEDLDRVEQSRFIRAQILSRSRETPLTTRKARLWFKPWWGPNRPVHIHKEPGENIISPLGFGRPTVSLTVRRGFVDEVACTMQQWLEYGSTIVAANPVTTVNILDKQAVHSLSTREGHRWQWCHRPHNDDALEWGIHTSIWQYFSCFLTETATFTTIKSANDALSTACLARARAVGTSGGHPFGPRSA